ncbi:MAG TPA: cytochrome P450 [Umezawaea sp.]|nr:cytochrome P450 [Umezawaea sp.]
MTNTSEAASAADDVEAPRFPTSRRTGCPFDPPPEFADLRAVDPMTRMTYPYGQIGWLVTGFEMARAVLSDVRFSSLPEGKLSPVKVPGTELDLDALPPGMFVNMDPPQHTRYRRLLNGHFTVRRVRLMETQIRTIVDGVLDGMERAGSPVDLVEEFAKPIPTMVTTELLGLPLDQREQFQHDVSVLFSLSSSGEEMIESMNRLGGTLAALVAAKRAAPTDDLLGSLVSDTDLTDPELLGITFVLLVAGLETTTNMLALGVFALFQHPEQLAALRADPTLMAPAVDELLRFLSVVQVGPVRVAAEDFEFEGRQVTKGDVVTVSLPAANRDPDRFPDADALDFDRRDSGHIAFGRGVHQCMGHHLARLELEVAYSALLERFPELRLATPAEGVPTREMMVTYGVQRLEVAW